MNRTIVPTPVNATFDRLAHLLETDPDAYRAEAARMNQDEPERFRAFVDELRARLSTTNRREDQKSGVYRTARAYVRRHSSIRALALGVAKTDL